MFKQYDLTLPKRIKRSEAHNLVVKCIEDPDFPSMIEAHPQYLEAQKYFRALTLYSIGNPVVFPKG